MKGFPLENEPQKGRSPLLKMLLAAPVVVLFFLYQTYGSPLALTTSSSAGELEVVLRPNAFDLGLVGKCPPQAPALKPAMSWVFPESYKMESVDRISKAIQIASVSYDDNGLPTEDPRWAPFFTFQDFLVETFPVVFETAKLEKVNTLGLLVTLEGSDPSLKPICLMSHYDVTPVPEETVERWTHGPFSGDFDGEYIWGRGGSDDKTLLISQYEALTELLERGFKPKRTIILSHGFDEEEVFARQGAGELAKFMEKRYGTDDPFLMVVDEGSSMNNDVFGIPMAIPAISEKGYLDVKVTVGTLGGHSSVPPAHSGIGIMSTVVKAIEDNPHPNSFAPNDPFLSHLQCAAEYAPAFPQAWKKLIEDPEKWSELANNYANQSLMHHALVTTTQAVDVIYGGVKVNSLPEKVTLLFNHRIAFSQNVSQIQDHLTNLLAPVAKEYGMQYLPFGKEHGKEEKLTQRFLKLETLGVPLDPAPITPLSGGVWDLFVGSVRAVHGKNLIVSPFGSGGNTDTKVMHNLSKNIFRFTGASASSEPGNAHTVDEKTSITAHLDMTQWIWTILQNADAYTGN